MYTLYYLNRSLQTGTIKVDNMDAPVLIPEDLVFCNLRRGINFIKEPHQCINFTDIERLIISSEFTDSELLKDYDFRKQNTYLESLCPVDISIVLDSAGISYFNDEGTVLIFPQNENLPQYNTDIYLSYDNLNFYKVFKSVSDLGFNWNDVNRLYFYHLTDFIPGHNLTDNVTIPPPYVYFQNRITGQRTITYTLDNTSFLPPVPSIVPDQLIYQMPNLTLIKGTSLLNASALSSPFVELYNINTQAYIDRFPILWSGDTGSIGNLQSGSGVQIRLRTQNSNGDFNYSPYLIIPHV